MSPPDKYAAFADALTDTFETEPAKVDELLEIMEDILDDSVELAVGVRKAWILLKDHPDLRNGFNECCLPPEANKVINDTRAYTDSVEEAFKDEPERCEEFYRIMKDVRTHIEDRATGFAKLKELMKDQQHLLPGLNALFPEQAETTISPEVNTTIAAPEVEIPTLSESLSICQQDFPRAYNLVAKVKERFQGDDNHVYESFLQILRTQIELNMSIDEVYREVTIFLQDHQDLVMEFADYSNKKNQSLLTSATDSQVH